MQVPFVRSLQPQLCAGLQPFLVLVLSWYMYARRADGDSTSDVYGTQSRYSVFPYFPKDSQITRGSNSLRPLTYP